MFAIISINYKTVPVVQPSQCSKEQVTFKKVRRFQMRICRSNADADQNLDSSYFLLLFTTGVVHAQSPEMGIFWQLATHKGEISNSLDTAKSLKPATGILYRRNLNSHWAYRIGITYGTPEVQVTLDSDDPLTSNRRNLSF
ncbi:MAG: hypothetical protein IPN13_04030 [Bacteroidetes bacterium]|nr:hypothetical protein [Bacteroidota bacterium]